MMKIKRLIVKEVNNCKITAIGDSVCLYFTVCFNQWTDTTTIDHAVGAKPELEPLNPDANKLSTKLPHLH